MKCGEIIDYLEKLAPSDLACSWDNVGLLAGSRKQEIHKVYVALDVTDEILQTAIDIGADMIISHHPLIFSPLKKVNDEDFVSRRIYEMIRNQIAYYAMHTNFDIAEGGMAEIAAEKLDIQIEGALEPVLESSSGRTGIGRYGFLTEGMTRKELCEQVKRVFQMEHVIVYGDLEDEKPVTCVAVSPGSGRSGIQSAIDKRVRVFITGDINHHDGIDATARGLCIIDAGHYKMEYLFISCIKEYLQQKFDGGILIQTEPYKVPNQII